MVMDSARIREITARLEAVYGMAHPRDVDDPVEGLVSCILSQHTSDVNSHRAWLQLRERFATWESVLSADPSGLADSIRCGGLAVSKARHIQAALREIEHREGRVDLSVLSDMSDQEARQYLMSLPGVGPKTAAIVLCFCLGRPVIPVDTHVFRVSWRLGLIERRIGEARAHDALQAMVPPELTFRFHVMLIEHGRRICRAQNPRCSECVSSDLCAYYRDGQAVGHDAR